MSASQLHFRPLETELAGEHTLDVPAIIVLHASDQLVLDHESIHDKLVYETEFGSIQRLFRVASQQARNPALVSCFDEWTDLLLSCSRVTHECAATYLSVKQAPLSYHSERLAKYPDEYRGYYEMLAGLIDVKFTSSFVQYVIAKIIIEVAMQPGLARRLKNWTPDVRTSIELRTDEKPDKRLHDLLRILPNRIGELRRKLEVPGSFGKPGLRLARSFNYQKEADWERLTAEEVEASNALLHDVIRGWMNPIAKTMWPSCTDWLQPCQTFVRRLEVFLEG